MFFTVEKIAKQLPEIRAAIYRTTCPIPLWKFNEGDCVGAEQPEFDDRGWEDFHTGSLWGGYDVTAWFRTRVPIPHEMRGEKLALHLVVGPRDGGDSTAETLLYVNGRPLQGLDVWHEEAWLPPEHLQGDEITVALKAWSGNVGVPAQRRFKVAELAVIDRDAECFFYLADTLLNTVRVLDANDLGRTRLLQALNEAFLYVDFAAPGSPDFYRSIAQASALLQQRVEPLQQAASIKPRVVAIGHAHLDMAWLWQLRHTRDKAARTFSTALHLMRQYPDYVFLHSSPQLYQFLKSDHPEIYRQVKQRIASGQWEISGGMWVEADTNIPNGESLVRQILFGKQFTRDEFGQETRVLWMPDVFGYSATLPQIMRQSGLDYLMTTKLSWNQFNRFPYDTFRWRGIDGSQVLTHFVTTPDQDLRQYTYSAEMTPYTVKGVWDHYKQQDVNDELLLLYGAGDGGGGPRQEMLEAAQVMHNLPGLPELELGTAEGFFERLGQRMEGKDLPVWDGELYLEYHRGTYTSQASNKHANRKSEVLYHDAELMSALADVLRDEERYPTQELHRGWEMILLNQFHDILPGSSIHAVYQDSQADYQRISEIGARVRGEAENRLLERIVVEQPSIVAFNSLGWPRDTLVEMPWTEALEGRTLAGTNGEPAPSQMVEENGEKKLLLHASNVPALGYRVLPLVPASDQVTNDIVVTPRLMENRYYRIALNEQGQITSLYDKVNEREVLAENGRGNVFQTFEDKPMDFDAWDIDIYYQDKMKEIGDLVQAAVIETGPLRGALRLQWQFHDSLITQRIILYRDSPRIDFVTEADWQEKQVLLKVAFPVAVRSTRATYDIQFGNIERPTHWNTSWDWARFEVPAHKWADLSEGDYGVSLLNDCKYGYDIKDNVMRLTLIKSSVRPDALADKGHHKFTYSLLPHAGDWRQSRVIQEAYALNYPVHAHLIGPWESRHIKGTCHSERSARALGTERGIPFSAIDTLNATGVLTDKAGDLPDHFAFATVDADNVILETVKRAQDGDGWILRLYETKQCRTNPVHLHFGHPIRRAVECNLLERDENPAAYEDHILTFSIKPYEIKTFKVWF